MMEDHKYRTHPEFIDMDTDVLQRIQTISDARVYVDDMISKCSHWEVLKCVRSYAIAPNRRRRVVRKKQSGGSEVRTCDDKHDVRVYELLQYIDSIHDAKAVRGITADRIYDVLGKPQLPVGFNSKAREAEVIDFLRFREKLTFGSDVVPNPLYRADIQLPQIVPLSDVAKQSRDRKISKHDRTWPLTIAMDKKQTTGKTLLQFRQILETISFMRTWFGNDRTFQPDLFHPITCFLLAMHLIDDAFHNKFVVQHDFAAGKYHDEINEILRLHVRQPPGWCVRVSDANAYDASIADKRLRYDRENVTGDVFRSDVQSGQVSLRGLGSSGKNVTVVLDGTESITFHASDAHLYTSTTSVFGPLIPGTGMRSSRSDRLLLAMKRAGDWGQVEHCKRFHKVFVTHDALAALYAFYRGVEFMLVRVVNHADDGGRYVCTVGRR
jgi:hypothetical protein